MPFTASTKFIILTAIFLEFFVVCLAFEIGHQLVDRLEDTEIDCELGEVATVHRDEADTRLLTTAGGELLPEYSTVDSIPPPLYKDAVDLGIFDVELEDSDDE
ncbi:hypothetical protein G6011_05645 [Alternaria panax]|uniref:Uncharacterized protein n=1 Tax=Alternaria panax TaxID=48097 RepID=A0AAD4FHQ1_9PLEO|nr:hypothetical protein G6011_05645 [Alternaria panax]